MTDKAQGAAELLPCPFCGGTDIRIYEHRGQGRVHGEHVYSMCCYACGATFPNRYRRHLMVDSWNRRAALKAQPAPTEAQGEDSARLDAIEVSVRKMHKGYEYGCGYYGQPVYIEGRDELFRRYGLPVDLDLDAAPQPQEQ